MTCVFTYIILSAAVILNGLITGLNIDRAFVQMPAWREVGVQAWAAYSRHSDLDKAFYLYPMEAIGGTILTITAAISFHFSFAPQSAAFPLYLSAILVP